MNRLYVTVFAPIIFLADLINEIEIFIKFGTYMYYMISTIYDQGLMLIEKQNMIFEYLLNEEI